MWAGHAISLSSDGTIEIRPERPADRDAVDEVHRAAFADHGAQVAGLVEGLRDLISDHRGVSLVAVAGGRVIGHVMLTPSLLDAPRALVTVQVLSPLGVLPAAQRRGVGSAMVRRGVEIVIGQGAPIVFLEGNPAYYSRLGFVAGASLGYRRPSLRIPRAFQGDEPPRPRIMDDGNARLLSCLLGTTMRSVCAGGRP